MRVCNQCKKENNDDAKFCKWCGSKILVYGDVQVQKISEVYNKPSSNQAHYNHNQSQNHHVSSQSTKIQTAVYSFNGDSVRLDKSKNKAIIAGILLLSIIGIGGAYYVNSMHNKEVKEVSTAKTYDEPIRIEQPKTDKQDSSAVTTRSKEKLQDTITVVSEIEEDLFYGLYIDGHGINSSSYVVAGSYSKYLTADDLSELTLQGLNYAKNEIYARHGRVRGKGSAPGCIPKLVLPRPD